MIIKNEPKLAPRNDETFQPAAFLASLPPDVARVIVRSRLRMLDLTVIFKKKYEYNLHCQFCNVESEHFDYIFISLAGVYAL